MALGQKNLHVIDIIPEHRILDSPYSNKYWEEEHSAQKYEPENNMYIEKVIWKYIISKWTISVLDFAVQVNIELDDIRFIFQHKHHYNSMVSTLLLLVDCSNMDQLCYDALHSSWGQC